MKNDNDLVNKIFRGINLLNVIIQCKVNAFMKQNIEMSNEIENLKHKLSESLLEIKQEKRYSEKLFNDYNNERQEIQKEVMQLQQMYQEHLNQVVNEYNNLKDHSDFIEGEINTINKTKEQMVKEKIELQNRISELCKQLKEDNEELQNKIKEIDDLKLDNSNLKDEINLLHLSQKYIKNDGTSQTTSNQIIKMADKIQVLTDENEKLKKEMIQLKSQNKLLNYSLQIEQEKHGRDVESINFVETPEQQYINQNDSYLNTSNKNFSQSYNLPRIIKYIIELDLPTRNDYPSLNKLLNTPSYDYIKKSYLTSQDNN